MKEGKKIQRDKKPEKVVFFFPEAALVNKCMNGGCNKKETLGDDDRGPDLIVPWISLCSFLTPVVSVDAVLENWIFKSFQELAKFQKERRDLFGIRKKSFSFVPILRLRFLGFCDPELPATRREGLEKQLRCNSVISPSVRFAFYRYKDGSPKYCQKKNGSNFSRYGNVGLTCQPIYCLCHPCWRPQTIIINSVRDRLGRQVRETGRKLLQEGKVSQPAKPEDDTVRVDPLDSLKKYRGGYDISNKHYWSSTIFTGIPGYSIGVAWLLCGLVFAIFLIINSICFPNKGKKSFKTPNCSTQRHFWHILLGTIFTVLAITATGVVLGGSSRFHSRSRTVKNIVLETADDASETLYNVTRVIRTMPDSLLLFDASGRLNSTADWLDAEAANIQRQANKNRRWVNLGLTIMYATTTGFIALNLVAILALLVLGFIRKDRLFYLLITLCWVVTALCWMCFGAYFFIEKFAGDTCTALEDYRTDPSNSSLSSILPCDDLVSAQPALQDVKAELYDLINQVNSNLSSQPESSLLSQVRICNPFSGSPKYTYQPQNCPANTIQIGDIPQIMIGYTCSGNQSEACIPDIIYDEVLVYTRAVQNILDAFPGMENLVDCKLVNDAINEILFEQCKPVKKFIRMVWVALAALSSIMVILILNWTAKAFHDRQKHSSDGSVNPHSATTDSSDEYETNTSDDSTPKTKPDV
ncbi:hypothetical protein H6P81_016004 [Aristolochia fimbriata]|uniref:Uncharacterized protein n=1 Tax=Aristolochia fimbriata TaxID=158543 RepID=A0AAV7E7G6_ARIFI|nr:hypothetical protein H6P81_016004 [Aristolochia fimbriata]